MDSWGKFRETSLPAKKILFRLLSGEHILDADYEHAHKVWSTFGCRTLCDYHDL